MRQGYAVVRSASATATRASTDGLYARALAFGVLDVPRIERTAKAAVKVETEGASEYRVVALPIGRFARDASVFAMRT